MRPHFPFAEPQTVSETGRWFLCCPLWWQWCFSRFLIPLLWLPGSKIPLSWWQLGKDVCLFKSLILCSLVVCCLFGCRSLLSCSGAHIGLSELLQECLYSASKNQLVTMCCHCRCKRFSIWLKRMSHGVVVVVLVTLIVAAVTKWVTMWIYCYSFMWVLSWWWFVDCVTAKELRGCCRPLPRMESSRSSTSSVKPPRMVNQFVPCCWPVSLPRLAFS